MATRKTGGTLDPEVMREIEKQTQKQQEIAVGILLLSLAGKW